MVDVPPGIPVRYPILAADAWMPGWAWDYFIRLLERQRMGELVESRKYTFVDDADESLRSFGYTDLDSTAWPGDYSDPNFVKYLRG